LLAIKEYNIECKLVNFSSAAVYGNPSVLPINESATKSPLSPYGIHKLQSEELLSYYHNFFGVKTCSLRVFSAYGEGLKKQLFWDLYQKYKDKETIILFGTGNESRDFIYINDLMQGLDLVIAKSNFNGEIINLSSGIETTIGEAVKIFYSVLNKNTSYSFNGEKRLGDPLNWRADISKIINLGFVSKTSITEGLKKYINWIKELE
jgi:dTDP-glucose 4,6-dehydratase/UDP-glucose 4-epimerase